MKKAIYTTSTILLEMDPSGEMYTCKDTQNFMQADMTIT